jgi:hypothetical protein
MSYHLTLDDTYDPSKLMPIKKIPYIQRLLLRLSFPFYLPKIAFNMLTKSIDRNPLHDGKRILSGIKKAASSGEILFDDVKRTAKRMKITINDLITSCMSAAIKQYFEKVGDTKTNKISIVIPANIRFKHYTGLHDLKLENKFAPLTCEIPLHKNVKSAIKEVHKVTSRLRSEFGAVYALYAATYYSAMFMPAFITQYFLVQSTLPYTLAFSNTPGLLKPLSFDGKKTIKM